MCNGIAKRVAARQKRQAVELVEAVKHTTKMLGNKGKRAGVRRKKVQFAPIKKEVIFVPSSSTSEEHEEMIRRTWYQRKELALLKTELRDYVLGKTSLVETRGLERFSEERTINKQIALCYILKATKAGMNHVQVAHVSRKCSLWTKKEAFQIGWSDYCEVYNPDKLSDLDKISSLLMPGAVSPLELASKKRSLGTSAPSKSPRTEGPDRRVKTRAC